MKLIRSDDDEEGSFLSEHFVFVEQNEFLEHSVVNHFGFDIVEVERFSHLIPELSVNWHGFHLH